MGVWTWTLVAVLALVSPAVSATVDPNPLFGKLLARDPGIRGDPAEPGPPVVYESLRGRLAEPAPGGAAETARRFLAEYGPLLGLPAGAAGGLVVVSSSESSSGRTLELAPVIDELPLKRAAIEAVLDRDGRLVAMLGRHVTWKGVKEPGIDARAAVRIALADSRRRYPNAALAGDGQVQELIDVGEDGLVHHFFTVQLPLRGKARNRRVTLDDTGRVVENVRQSLHDVAEGRAYDAAALMANLPAPGTPPSVKSRKLADVVLEDLSPRNAVSGEYAIDGKYFYSITSKKPAAGSKDLKFELEPLLPAVRREGRQCQEYDPRFLEVNIYHLLTQARRFALEAGATQVASRRLSFNPWTLGSFRNNAQYSANEQTIRFAALNPTFGEHPGIDPTVVWHEYGHCVMDSVRPDWSSAGYGYGPSKLTGFGMHEVASLQEGFADFFAAALAGQPRQGALYYNPLRPELVRNSDNTRRQPDFFSADPHEHGQLISGFLWSLREKLGGGKAGSLAATRLAVIGLRTARWPLTFRRFELAVDAAYAQLRRSGEFAGADETLVADLANSRGLDIREAAADVAASAASSFPAEKAAFDKRKAEDDQRGAEAIAKGYESDCFDEEE